MKKDKIINIFRSPVTSCWDGDLDTGIEMLDDVELAAIAEHGFNGIWIHQPLRDYTPSKVFPEFGKESSRYLELLEALTERAARHGIRIYMYLLEPRAILAEDPFWQVYPELRGQHFFQQGFDLNYYSLCSSQPRVREYLYDSMEKLCSRIDMDFFSITAAEDFSTCIGKLVGREKARNIHCCEPKGLMVQNDCPLCSQRTGADVIAELLNTMYDGIYAGNRDAYLIAWDWGWRKLPWEDTEKNILDALRDDIIYISDFEIGGEREFHSNKGIYEYSLGYVGPSESFSRLTTYASEQGRRVGGKLQIGTTHELASVPNLPLIHNLWEKIDRLRKHKATVAFTTWNLGTYRTLNTWLFGHAFSDPECRTWEDFLELALDYLGVPEATAYDWEKAWSCFELALEFFPFNVPMLYQGPINYAPAYWLPPRKTAGKPMGMSCHIVERGDDLNRCCGDCSLDEIIERYEKVVNIWHEGLAYIENIKAGLPEPTERFMEEYRNAVCIGHVYRSTLNIFRIFKLCHAWNSDMRDDYIAISKEEISNREVLLKLTKDDPRLGMHLECKGYMFNPELIQKSIDKISNILNFS